MSNPRLAAVFQRCKHENRAAFISYLTAGDPSPQESLEAMMALASESDILEIGMPFSDPMADGPVIQAASERALTAGTHMDDLFAITGKIREKFPELGIVLMGYANLPYSMGFETFAQRASSAGADGVLIVDIPPEEGAICDEVLRAHDLDRILLLSPTSPDERIRLVCKKGSGFIYYVSLTGITGADMGDSEIIREKTRHIQEMSSMPVCVGFGVKTASQAAIVGNFADGVVVGSHFVAQITEQSDHNARCRALTQSAATMRSAIKSSRR